MPLATLNARNKKRSKPQLGIVSPAFPRVPVKSVREQRKELLQPHQAVIEASDKAALRGTPAESRGFFLADPPIPHPGCSWRRFLGATCFRYALLGCISRVSESRLPLSGRPQALIKSKCTCRSECRPRQKRHRQN
jgi:hypothetical protein